MNNWLEAIFQIYGLPDFLCTVPLVTCIALGIPWQIHIVHVSIVFICNFQALHCSVKQKCHPNLQHHRICVRVRRGSPCLWVAFPFPSSMLYPEDQNYCCLRTVRHHSEIHKEHLKNYCTYRVSQDDLFKLLISNAPQPINEFLRGFLFDSPDLNWDFPFLRNQIGWFFMIKLPNTVK